MGSVRVRFRVLCSYHCCSVLPSLPSPLLPSLLGRVKRPTTHAGQPSISSHRHCPSPSPPPLCIPLYLFPSCWLALPRIRHQPCSHTRWPPPSARSPSQVADASPLSCVCKGWDGFLGVRVFGRFEGQTKRKSKGKAGDRAAGSGGGKMKDRGKPPHALFYFFILFRHIF